MRQGLQKKLVLDVPRFVRFGTEKFSSRGHIVKQRAHFDLRSWRFPAVAHRLGASAIYQNLRARNRAWLASRQSETRNTRDARQRFAGKPECSDGSEIGCRCNLDRCMCLERRQSVVAVHPAAVSDDWKS